jgi:hypothetical protein
MRLCDGGQTATLPAGVVHPADEICGALEEKGGHARKCVTMENLIIRCDSMWGGTIRTHRATGHPYLQTQRHVTDSTMHVSVNFIIK